MYAIRSYYEPTLSFEGGIELVDIGLVMLGVVDLHGFGIEIGLEGIVAIW